jgi:hypothetical protein
MENNDFKEIWRDIHSQIKLYSPVELKTLLNSKIDKTINSFLGISVAGIIVSCGFIIFLSITALNHRGDLIYQVNNMLLILITITSLISSILSLKALQKNKNNLPVKDWLEKRIDFLNKGLKGQSGKLYIFLIPVLMIMMTISIHVYYEYKPFMEVMKNEKSLYGMFFGFFVGLWVAFYAVRKIRKYQKQKLTYLKHLYAVLTDDGK